MFVIWPRFLARRKRDRELQQEIALHLEEEIGMTSWVLCFLGDSRCLGDSTTAQLVIPTGA